MLNVYLYHFQVKLRQTKTDLLFFTFLIARKKSFGLMLVSLRR